MAYTVRQTDTPYETLKKCPKKLGHLISRQFVRCCVRCRRIAEAVTTDGQRTNGRWRGASFVRVSSGVVRAGGRGEGRGAV